MVGLRISLCPLLNLLNRRAVSSIILLILVVGGQGSRELMGQESTAQTNTSTTDKLDRVEYRQGITVGTKIGVWDPLQVMTLEGQVQSFDTKGLVLIVKNKDGNTEPKTINSDQVQRIFPAWRGAGTEAAVKLFEQHKYEEFAKSLSGLDQPKIPVWQRVLISSMVAQVYEAQGNLKMAGNTFIDLAKLPIPDLVYGDIPLAWTVSSIDIADSAKKWIEQDSEAAKLLGASWLLMGPDAQTAKAVLAELTKSKTSAISQLAKAQSWRLVPAPKSMTELPVWISERDRMLQPLSLGPTEFLSDRLMRIGQHDLAIGFAFQIATSHSNRFPRAKRSLDSAAAMLKKQQLHSDADKVSTWVKQLDGAN